MSGTYFCYLYLQPLLVWELSVCKCSGKGFTWEADGSPLMKKVKIFSKIA